MSAKRVVIYMPDAIVEALNHLTAISPRSRSEIICSAVELYLSEATQQAAAEPVGPDEAFFDRVAEMMQSGLLQPGDFSDPATQQELRDFRDWANSFFSAAAR